MAYKKCPRCSLNYIKDTEVLCKVCLEEVGDSLRNSDEEEEYDICPECGEQIIKAGEEMCYQCALEQAKEEPDIEDLKDKDWDSYAHDDDDAVIFDDDDTDELQEIEIELDEDVDELEENE
ncbi:MAG TPA: hypothetical protein PKO35_10000 [Candidatus Atribacteria bacterium]|nr:hypothetical protein [Candidatus Atribacteria bacterium]